MCQRSCAYFPGLLRDAQGCPGMPRDASKIPGDAQEHLRDAWGCPGTPQIHLETPQIHLGIPQIHLGIPQIHPGTPQRYPGMTRTSGTPWLPKSSRMPEVPQELAKILGSLRMNGSNMR